MRVHDEAAYERWKKNNDDAYGKAIFQYAERWADLMERKMKEGKTLESVAEATSHEADTEMITGRMRDCAVSTLVLSWVHGEELRRWNNGSEEGSGVLSSSILVLR